MRNFNKSFTFLLIIAFVLAGYVSAAVSFNPQEEVTRAQFVEMLVQAMEYKKIDSVSFIDMKPYPTSKPHWASVYIETALRNGVIVKAEEGDRFYPDAPISRKDMVMMMCRALKLEPSEGPNPYHDLDEPDGYFTKAYEEYLVRGIPMNGKIIFNPTGVTTRAQAAVIIARLVDYKADPEGFVAKAAMEERFANGTATAEDIALKRELEIEKAKADPNYIMEPIITVEYNTDPWTYEYFRLYFENIADYNDDEKWELEVTNYKQLNNYEMPRPDGTFVKDTITGWRPLGSRYKDRSRVCFFILGKNYYTTQALIKDFPIYAGMKIEFKITVNNGLKERVIHKTVLVNDIK
ncbi:MAG: S-layer homology domain-containing protein, partial [Gracilibacteraceae bacterium]|nr:S-layer homology domain-containing protein [Gracilibacteraceae bacterium]